MTYPARCVFAITLVMQVSLIGSITETRGDETRSDEPASDPFRAGAAVVDVSPISFPVTVNGGMTSRTADKVVTPVNARAIVMAQGDREVALVVVDSCMMPRFLLDEAKAMAASRTGIPRDRIMISATHTHTAPASMSCLGTDADPEYQAYLRIKLVEAIETARSNLRPAQAGFGVIDAADYMAIRRWIRRPDRIENDPFGNPTVRANMHAGRNWDDVTGPSGPEDPDLTLISLRSTDGEPIAVLANLSMHYFSGPEAISADYFGLFSDGLQRRIGDSAGDDSSGPPGGPPGGSPGVVGIMSHGCSGDIWRLDYTKQTPPEFETITIDDYTSGLLDLAMEAYRGIEYQENPKLEMAETRLNLRYRVPDAERLQWAREIVEQMGDRLPLTTEEVYAREQLYLHQWQSGEVVVQAIRVGDIGIATTPTETYALTGMKIKNLSPLAHTMVIELANGGDGYIPPPEQHVLGGYNTWPARSAGLEVAAEPKIAEAAVRMLEQVAGSDRKEYRQSVGSAAESILASGPIAYWRMDEMAGPRARDVSGNDRDGIYEPGVVFFLDGPDPDSFTRGGEVNRAAHFAGGRMRARVGDLPREYSVSMWIWNGMPTDGRGVTGWFYSRGVDFARPPHCEQLGLGGTDGHAGKLILRVGSEEIIGGKTEIPRWTWNHVRMVRDASSIRVHLNGDATPEIETEVVGIAPRWADEFFFGGSSEGVANWEGRIDEVVISETSKP